MTDREALFKAILQNPDDDTPKLVYADYLQDQDNQEDKDRAEFIQICYAMQTIGSPRACFEEPIKSYGPGYYRITVINPWRNPLKVGDRVDVQKVNPRSKKARALSVLRRSGTVEPPSITLGIRDSSKITHHGLRITRMDADDPSFGTLVLTLKQDAGSVPYPQKEMIALEGRGGTLLRAYPKWSEVPELLDNPNMVVSLNSPAAFRADVASVLSGSRFYVGWHSERLTTHADTFSHLCNLWFDCGFATRFYSTWQHIRNCLAGLLQLHPIHMVVMGDDPVISVRLISSDRVQIGLGGVSPGVIHTRKELVEGISRHEMFRNLLSQIWPSIRGWHFMSNDRHLHLYDYQGNLVFQPTGEIT